jgi:hypothetical protein
VRELRADPHWLTLLLVADVYVVIEVQCKPDTAAEAELIGAVANPTAAVADAGGGPQYQNELWPLDAVERSADQFRCRVDVRPVGRLEIGAQLETVASEPGDDVQMWSTSWPATVPSARKKLMPSDWTSDPRSAAAIR